MAGLGAEWRQLLDDLERGMALLESLPPAVTFFGGARITTDDPCYALSREIGRRFARLGIPPRTGAGPGIMTSVPEGYRAGVAALNGVGTGAFAAGMVEGFEEACRSEAVPAAVTRTQGIKIYLPFEPEINEHIDLSVELLTFPIRRLMLYENSLGLVCFPGGFGTLDELFEVWSRRERPAHRDPIVLVGQAFYGPIVAALRRGLLERAHPSLPEPRLLDAVLVTDDAEQVVQAIAGTEGLVGFDEEPRLIARRLGEEIPFVAGALQVTPPAITVLGGASLPADDPALRAGEAVLEALARGGRAVRLGNAGALAERAHAIYAARGQLDRLQAFWLAEGAPGGGDAGRAPDRWEGAVRLEVTDPIAHKLLLTQRTRGLLALPGDLRTLDEVFSVLCEVQTGKMPRLPLVLLDSACWGPILAACRAVMLTGERRTIAPADLELVTIVDTAEEALAALLG